MYTDDRSTGETPTPETAFDLLTSRRRRLVLSHLLETDGAVPIETLTRWLEERTDEGVDAAVCLHHRDLPRLADAGMLRYRPEERTVRLLEPAAELAPYLEFAGTRGRR